MLPKDCSPDPPLDASFELITSALTLHHFNTDKTFKKPFFHLATYIFLNFQIEPELSAGINPGMAFTPISI